jgi:hypothetical protein
MRLMRARPLRLAALLGLGIISTHASATILTYDDIPAGPISAPGFIEDGFQFSNNMVAIDIAPGSLWPNAHPLSGNNAALNDYLGDAVITQVGGGTFSFINTYMAGWNTETVGGTITGYLNGAQVGQVTWFALGPDAGGGRPVAPWSLITANFLDVDTVVIDGGNTAFLLENTQVGPAVLEPSTWAMMLLGFAGLGFLAHRQSRKAAGELAAA